MSDEKLIPIPKIPGVSWVLGTQEDKERAEFEAYKPGSFYMSRNNAPGTNLSEYHDPFTNAQWLAWQASAERSAKRIAEVKAGYEAEECIFDDQNLLVDHAERYSLSMPDSHAKVVMHELAKSTKDNLSRIAELEAEVVRLNNIADTLAAALIDIKIVQPELTPGPNWNVHVIASMALSKARAMKDGKFCSYPDCNCPFDAPADPSWCARGYPHKTKGGA